MLLVLGHRKVAENGGQGTNQQENIISASSDHQLYDQRDISQAEANCHVPNGQLAEEAMCDDA